MREIKFRAWDKISKVMRYGAENNLVVVLNSSDFEVMQYTGLHDKNGKEIYEGDLVLCNVDPSKEAFKETREVVWTDHFWAIKGFDGSITGMAMPEQKTYGVEVIGNKFENTELLNT